MERYKIVYRHGYDPDYDITDLMDKADQVYVQIDGTLLPFTKIITDHDKGEIVFMCPENH